MGIIGWLSKLTGIGGGGPKIQRISSSGHDIRELARRLGTTESDLASVQPAYREFHVKKRSGGIRQLQEPSKELKEMQRRILHRLLKRLSAHEAAHGYEAGRSIVTNAQPHTNKDLVVKADLKDFFARTSGKRIRNYFLFAGWSEEAADILTRLTIWQNGLPQGAPTSPRLANLVNFHMDARLQALAVAFGGSYTRYADDLTFSFANPRDVKAEAFLKHVSRIVRECGYEMHGREKLRVMTYKSRQSVTGLVVNQKVDLPRKVRKWLRAVENHKANGREATLSDGQLNGWKAFRQMIIDQRRIL